MKGLMMLKQDKKEKQEKQDKGEFTLDLRQLALYSIKFFLEDKKDQFNEKLDINRLLTNDNVKIVLRTQFDDDTFLFIHDNCLSKIPKDQNYRDNSVPWNVHYLLGLLADLKMRQLPKEFQPGLILLYFKYCKGLEILPTPLL